jgi:branched-chain amino acid transport system permease protein
VGLIQTLVLGLLVGAVYGLFSVGLSLVFGVMRIVNFAYGEFVMLGMYLGYVLSAEHGISIYVGLPLVVLVALPIGFVTYFLFFRSTGVKSGGHDQLIIALGLSVLLQAAAANAFGDSPRALEAPSVRTFHIGSIYIPGTQLVAFAVAVLLVLGLEQALRRTDVGRAVRAIVADREMALLAGIPTERIFTLAFSVSIALAGAAGVVLVGYYSVSPTTGSSFILLGFIATVLGGVGDIRGAFAAGLLIGITQIATATYVNGSVQNVAIYIVFVIVALLRPQGLLGNATT